MKITVNCINDQNIAYWDVPKNTLREMDFEQDYMPGAVAAEMGNCKETEALKAQAIAARSFAYQYIKKGAAIYDTGKAQAYLASRAVSASYKVHRQAAENTVGIVLTYNGKPVTVHYTASNGGIQQSAQERWGGVVPYEIHQIDPWDNSAKIGGHGVGMSQNGAENMAKAGKTYQEILSFYYPGTILAAGYGDTMLTESKSDDGIVEVDGVTNQQNDIADKIVSFARAQVGEPYVFGASGPDKWDCSGLTKRAAELAGYNWYHGATTQWNRGFQSGDEKKYGYWADSGTIDALPTNKLAFLFNRQKSDTSKMAHTGIYDGAGNVIQAGGYGGSGVHDNPIDARRWTHWATLKGVDGTMSNTTPITLRNGSSGEWVRTLQLMLNDEGAGLKVDGKFGPLTEKAVREFQAKSGLVVDGIFGPISWNCLLSMDNNDGILYNILGLTKAQAEAVVAQYQNATMEKQE